ncbi:vegetative incompatibility protein HET-E-1 [Cadophora sp. DSE1049]|nr:vegetative incompatibility protein HET-E-1 [Cadophora sp. DSE1049]
MRLLQSDSDGNLSLAEFFEDDIPEYAILSHRWEGEEVTFKDLTAGTSKPKAGYGKIQFCGEQARRDGLEYFWVDTCCIDKSSSAELSEAINSMFRWYQKAARCYVYLSDVSIHKRKASDTSAECTWESAFRVSKWFTRGWTLQELLAPRSVEFFSWEGKRLGNKKTLEQQIHEITGIPASAVREYPLAQFDVDERFSWAKGRQTTRGEDKAYSLFGIFDVQMPLLYGEGEVKAFQRLRDAIDKLLKEQKLVLSRLRFVNDATFDSHDEEHNARCYQGTRVELLRHIETWASDLRSGCVFWLNGMAGTGKSTISRTIAQKFDDKGDLGASFFFKRGEGDRGDAGMLIETIVTQLVQKLPSFAPHVQKEIEDDLGISRKGLKLQFETLILQPLRKMPKDPQKSSRAVIIIDALDECDQEEDIGIIIRLLPQVQRITSVQLKFFLTSRPELSIRLGFEDIRGKYEGLALHQILEPIVKEDISTFLEYELATIRHNYNKSVRSDRQLPVDWPGRTKVQILVDMATPLFIFATTVCRFIRDRRCGGPNEQLVKVLEYRTKSQASKLDATYLPVLNQLLIGVSESEKRGIVKDFQQVVGSIVILARPLSVTSLDRLLGVCEGTVESRTDLLHSVLSIPSCPDHPIRLLHLSFRDFLVDTEKRNTNPLWINEADAHSKLGIRCLELLSTGDNLKKDICNLRTPETPRAEVDQRTIRSSLPPDIQYASLYWVYHFTESGTSICDNDQTHTFLRCYFLHWLESLSFIGRLRESIGMVENLMAMMEPIKSTEISRFLYDAKRFILNCCSIVDLSPLQLYSSALIFAPKESIIRNTFYAHIPHWILQHPDINLRWNAVLQTLEGHNGAVSSVAFSHDSKLLVSTSTDTIVKVWNTATGMIQQTLEGHSDMVWSAAFSYDSKLLASASLDTTIKVWDVTTGILQQTLNGHKDALRSVAFSHNSKLLASASHDKTVKIWDTTTGMIQQTLEGHSDRVWSVAFSHNSKLLASASWDTTIKIWDPNTGTLKQTLVGHKNIVWSAAFSCDSKLLASASDDMTIKVWDVATGMLQQTLEGHRDRLRSVAFAHDSKLLASASCDKTVKVWDVATGTLKQTLEGHSDTVESVIFSHNSKLLASASSDMTVKVWDAAINTLQPKLEGHKYRVSSVTFSYDSKLLVTASWDTTVKVWDATTGKLQQTLKGHSDRLWSVAFSHDSKLIASASFDKTVKVWDTITGTLQQTLEGHSNMVWSAAFSYDSKLLASASYDKTVKVWDVVTGTLQQTLEGHKDTIRLVAFSYDSKLLASASVDNTVNVWVAATGMLRQTLVVHNCVSALSFDITNSTLITNIGRIQLDISRAPLLLTSTQDIDDKGNRKGMGISGHWVTWNSKNLLWLPPDFRAISSDISPSGSTIAVGCQSGKVFIIGVSFDS